MRGSRVKLTAGTVLDICVDEINSLFSDIIDDLAECSFGVFARIGELGSELIEDTDCEFLFRPSFNCASLGAKRH